MAVAPSDPKRVRAALDGLAGRRVAVVGAGRSGLAAARLLIERGAQVEIEDDKGHDALAQGVAAAGVKNCKVRGNGIGAARLSSSDLVVVSPGVPLARPELVQAAAHGVLIISEIDVALAVLHQPVLAVTGTNGKSTTTTMLGALLQAGGARPFVGGNLGSPLSEAALQPEHYGSLVVELSSYQLELCSLLQPQVAVITNLAPDHLDRYPDVEAYYAAKRRILDALDADGAVVTRRRDVLEGRLSVREGQRWLLYGTEPTTAGAQIGERELAIQIDGLRETFAISNPHVRGAHNRENLAAAVLAALAYGLRPQQVLEGIDLYGGISHRLESVERIDEVLYVNDSKGTNVDATVQALRSFDTPILLIAGGRDKGTGYAALREAAQGRVRVLLTIGEAAPLIVEALRDVVEEVVSAETLQRAVQEAALRARADEVVLLSPACSSFDQFANFEQRGQRFVEAVSALRGGA